MTKLLTRRDFLKGSAGLVIGSAVGLPAQTAPKSRVVLIRHPEAVEAGSRFNAPVIQQMLDEAIVALLDAPDAARAWKMLVKPGEVIGIKSNVWSYLPTPAEVEQYLKRRVMEAGIKEGDIAIDDHGVKENPVFQRSTSLINVRPLRTHYLSGMSGCIKNIISAAAMSGTTTGS
jgi:hypothetical protein